MFLRLLHELIETELRGWRSVVTSSTHKLPVIMSYTHQ